MTLVVYGSDCSYYTGKLEAYLRAKGIAYRLEPFGRANMRRAARSTGVVQIPQVELPDGSWLVDSTKILAYFEAVRPEPCLRPFDPSLAFLSRLIEDFADEWLWRPAMHFRWSYPANARLMSGWLAEHAAELPGPDWLKRLYWYRRQLGTFVVRDGVDAKTGRSVESVYEEVLDALEGLFARQPFVLGGRPCEADFGFFASMFRHFACDPVPGRIMRTRAPGVHEWVARMWNLTPERIAGLPPIEVEGSTFDALARALHPLLVQIGRDYLPYLDANAAAFAAGEAHTRSSIRGIEVVEPTKPYR
ncbi:glutathione S-transferase C-terminal domain-containing protein, partial [Myxococcota bacterium]|nr:glutathione S-transferase C-terminal domain-containing protein [Myxococcota bacterium]